MRPAVATFSNSVMRRIIAFSDDGGGAPPPVYDPDAVALFARFATPADDARKQLISDRFVAGKAKSFWAKLDALWVHAAHGAEAGRLNWLGDIYNCQPINNPTFTPDRGYLPDGSSSYLDTSFNPSTASGAKHVQNSASLGIRSNTDNTGSGSLAGFFSGNGTTINPRVGATGTVSGRIHQTAAATSATAQAPTAIGMYIVNRNGATDMKIHREGLVIMTATTASTAPVNGNYRLGSISDASYRNCQFSMGFIASGLTDAEGMDLFNWFEPYRIAVGVT